jgi:MSHA biogenesis protein MshQ
MSRLIKCVLINLLYVAVFVFTGSVHATVRVLNNGGGTNSSNALEVTIADSTQMQIKRLGSGQLYQPGTYPSGSYPYNSLLDNGVYMRYNNRIYGANHFAYSAATIYNSFSISSVQPGSTSQGVTQSTTSSLSLTSSILSSPTVSIVWKYTYPLDYITAEVTLTIPATATVSTNNPIRYYHAVDTYLGGNDNGCGVRYTDANGKLVVGTYPLTNGTCPSSSSLPPNLDVVESFRERSGKFDHHCVGYWSDFWSTATSSPPACSISKSGSLGDSVTTTYQDTGAAIEFDFTAPGIYTFSYDFVVGSTFVPNYDHFEIRHAGSATLCPTEVKVLACLSSTVPCPDDQLVSSGELKGSLTVSPTTPTVTDTPDPFTLGSNQSIGTVTMQGSAAATYTLGVSGLTKAPLSGVKCWNTATSSQSCSFTFTNTPCVNTFECMENALTYTSSGRNPLYTKLLGRDFDVDVVALLANGSQSSGYNSVTGLTVDLVVESGGTCSTALTDIVATKLVTFAASDNGRKKVTFAASDALAGGYPKVAYPKLRCRVRDLGLAKTGCSSDNFTVRPLALSVTSSDALQTASGATPSDSTTTRFRAARDFFSLSASSGEAGYNGTPKIRAKVQNDPYVPLLAHPGAPIVGVVTGAFPQAASGVSTGTKAFQYSEVGHFKFKTSDVYDDTFASVDITNGDCIVGSFANEDLVNTPKKYGCNFGNTGETYYFGRFIPDRFEITTGTVVRACGAFAYYGQDTTNKAALEVPFTITATNGNLTPATTQNYVGSYAKFDPAAWASFNFTTNPALTTVALTRSTATNSLIGSWVAGVAAMNAKFYVPRSNVPINEQIVTVRTQIQDTDGVTTAISPFAIANTVPFRYGRLAITPVHGSELLPLTVPIEAQYWSSTGYRRSTEDSCTAFDIKTIAMPISSYRGNLNACETVLSGSTSMIQGKMNLRLSAPGVTGNTPNTGSVDLDLNFEGAGGDQTCVGPGTTQSNAIAGTAGMRNWFGADPLGRATFGVYKAPIIYMRENF